MKLRLAPLVFCLSAWPLAAQNGSQPATVQPESNHATASNGEGAHAAVDPVKTADIRRLLEVLGTKELMESRMDSMLKTIRPLMVSSLPPGDYRDKLIDLFFERFRSESDIAHLLDLAIPIYDKYFSDEEVKALISFYETPLGRKTVTVLPKTMAEMQTEGQKWGEQLGRQCMQEVLAEHPDLAAQLAAAEKARAGK